MSKASKGPDRKVEPPSPPSQSGAWRVFCAIEIPENVSRQVAEHTWKLKARFPNAAASWSREGKFHLTLKFLGNVPQDRIELVSRAAAQATENSTHLLVKVAGTGVFPKHGPPRVLWIGMEDSRGKLGELQMELERACEPLGFPREERPFHPHLTIARLRNPQGARELGLAHKNMEFEAVEISVEELIVFRSELGREGSKYTALSRHPLR